MSDLIANLLFIFQRVDWIAVIDILLVTLIFFGLLYLMRDTQLVVLLRGIMYLIIVIALLTSFGNLPAFAWLLNTALPALLFSIPVIFAPEIRRALERIGRAGTFLPTRNKTIRPEIEQMIQAVVNAVARLSARQHGALIIIQRLDPLDECVRSGVALNAEITSELLLQVFYPNTPLHDGAAVIENGRIVAAACVMPLSSSGILAKSPDRQMGLRHRAALGISEASDAIAIVVSEESGSISIAHTGRMIRRLDAERLKNILTALYSVDQKSERGGFIKRHFPYLFPRKEE